MKTYIELGPVPTDEKHIEDDGEQARKECRAFISQLRRQFGREVGGAKFSILITGLSSSHTVIIKYDDSNYTAATYAATVKRNLPIMWDPIAKAELNQSSTHSHFLI